MKLLSRLLALVALPLLAATAPAQTLDTLVFGNSVSEQNHALATYFPPATDVTAIAWVNEPAPSDPSATPPSEVISGGMGLSARRLLPRTPNGDVYGGQMTFTMAVDPLKQNYVSLKMWGSDAGKSYLLLNVNGQEVGNRHGGGGIGEDPLYFYGTGWLDDRFFYRTEPLPLHMTRGRTQVTITIRSLGYMYFYAGLWTYVNSYQNIMKAPSPAVYTAYTHAGTIPDTTGEIQGSAPSLPTPRALENETTAIANLKTNVNNLLASRLNADPATLGQSGAADLARIHDAKTQAGETWITYPVGKTETDLANQIIAALDSTTAAFALDATKANGWGGGFGPFGETLINAWPLLSGSLDTTVAYGGTIGTTTRRAAWSTALRASVDNGRFYRRTIANQEIDGGWNIYRANRGLLLLDPTKALLEEESLRYFKEGCGILPFLGNDLRTGGTDGLGGGPVPTRNTNPPNGPDWYMTTSKGTTKDGNGFVGSDYGELGSWVYKMGLLSGDATIQQRGIQMVRARLGFRYPGADDQGYLTMMGSNVVGVRGNSLPGHYAYLGRGNADDMLMASQGAAVIGADILGAYQQLIRYGQAVRTFNNQDPYLPGRWAAVKAMPATNVDLPVTDGAPDFAWADEENMVVAAKHGDERFYANLFWRQPDFINGLVKVFHLTSNGARIADVMADDIRFRSTGGTYMTATHVDNFATPPDKPVSAFGGQPQAIAWRSDLATIPTTNRDGGRGTGYTFRYGNWLVGINAHHADTYAMQMPSNFTSATDLISKTVKTGPVVLAPKTSAVFYLPTAVDPNPAPSRTLVISASGGNGGNVLGWTHASGASTYSVLRSTTPGGAYTTLSSGLTEPRYTDTAVTNGTTYYYVVTATGTGGTGGYSSEVSATPTGPQTAGLVSPWSDLDLGASTGGSASVSGNNYTVTSGPGDISSSADNCHFIYQPVVGDFVLTARLDSSSSPNNYSKAGLMVRDSLVANSPSVSMNIQARRKLALFDVRGGYGGGTGSTSAGSGLVIPYWVRLQRAGSTLSGYISADGINWTLVGSIVSTSISYEAYVGFAAAPASGNVGQTNTAVFSNVTFPSGTNTAVPPAPSGLAATPGVQSVALTWAPVNSAAGYTLSRRTGASGPFTVLATGLSTSSYTDYGLTQGTTYHYIVTAANIAGPGANSAPLAITLGTPPAAVTGLVAAPSTGQVGLSWASVSGATSYTVTRATTGVQPAIIASGLTTTGYVDTGLIDGTPYTYGVYAVNAAGRSDQGGVVTVLPPGYIGATLATQDVGSPQGGAAAHANGTYTLVGAGNLTGLPVDGFRYAFESITGDFIASARVTSLTNNSGSDSAGLMVRASLDPSSAYYYTVVRPGYSVNGQSRDTQNGAVGYTGTTTGLTLPYWIRLQRTGNLLTAYRSADGVAWTNIGNRTIALNASALVGLTATSNNANIFATASFDNYSVLTNTATGGTATASTQSTGGEASKAFDGTASTKWYNNQLGGTGWLAYQFASGVTQIVTRYQLTSASDVQQRDPRDWQFQGSNDGVNWTTLDTRANQVFAGRYQSNVYTVTGNATAYSRHRLNITANSGGSGYGLQLAELTFLDTASTSAVPPLAPAGLSATWSNAQVSLAWPAALRATSYHVKRSTVSGGPYTTVAANLTATAHTDTGLTNGTTYYYVVTAVNAAGESIPSIENGVTPLAPPAIPSGLAATAGDTRITLAWSAANGASSYRVKRATDSGGSYAIVGSTAGTGYTDLGLVNGTTYYYVVTAMNLAAESASSAPASTTPVISAPTGLAATLGQINGAPLATLNWNAVPGATGYTVKRSATINGTYSPVGTTASTSLTNPNLAYGTTYYYKVTAFDAGSTSVDSGALAVTPTLGTVSASSENAPNETTAKAFDGLANTKWYNRAGAVPASASGWIQYQFENNTAKVVKAYTITSANDVPARDPYTWQLLGSNTANGTDWVVLDTRTAEIFSTRWQNRLFTIGNTTAYSYYRLNITDNYSSHMTPVQTNTGVQLGEFKLITGLPSPWSTADIGTSTPPGGAGADSGIFTLVGSGTEITGTADRLRYVWQTATGDCEIIARVTGFVSANSNPRAGVMIRESSGAGSIEASVTLQAGNSITYRTRSATGGATTNVANVTSLSRPYWVRLTRVGNVFTAYRSPDGQTWTIVGTPATIAMTTNIQIGLAGTSLTDGTLSVFTLDNLTVTP